MSVDLVVDNDISTSLETVNDQHGNSSALSIAKGIVRVEGSPSGDSVQMDVYNPKKATNQVAGIRFHTGGSDWTVMLRTRQDKAWLELTDVSGNVVHLWNGRDYTTKGKVTAGKLQVTGSSVIFSGLQNLPSSGTADLTVDASGNVAPQTSSARFKEDIEPLQEDFHKIFSADPVSFTNKSTGDREIGYLAENLHENNLENLVSYDAEGKPLSVQYKMLPLYVLEIMKEQQHVIKELQEEIAGIKEEMTLSGNSA